MELWQRRSFRKLLNLIDHLPGHSHFAAAVANDDEHAEMLLEAQGESKAKGRYTPPINTWTPEVAALASVQDLLKNVISAVISSSGAKPPEFKPTPRPETALDRVRREKGQKVYADLAAILTPGR